MAWANEDRGERIMKTRQYTKSEYDKRADLHFIVKYKSMTAVIVELGGAIWQTIISVRAISQMKTKI
mgnify:CR=1 FL=1